MASRACLYQQQVGFSRGQIGDGLMPGEAGRQLPPWAEQSREQDPEVMKERQERPATDDDREEQLARALGKAAVRGPEVREKLGRLAVEGQQAQRPRDERDASKRTEDRGR